MIVCVWKYPSSLVRIAFVITNKELRWKGFLPDPRTSLNLTLKYPFGSLLSLTQNKARSQLRISGLSPSAYWFGQALVDVPMYCLIFVFMYLMSYSLSLQDGLNIYNLFGVIIWIIQVSDDIRRTNIIV